MKEINSDFLERLLYNYDSDIDLSEGGPAWQEVIQPILDRLDPDPLEVPFQEFALQLLRDRFPTLSFTEGNALADSVAKAMQFLMRPNLDQLTITHRQSSLRSWNLMSEDELDARLSNFFTSRQEGGYAGGPARIYFANPTTQTISSGNVFYSKAGLRFYPNLPQTIAADTMLTNKEGDLYYMDVQIKSEAAGEDYNVVKGDIVSVTGVPQAVSVTNLRKFEGGLERDSNEDAVINAQQAIIEQSLGSVPGIFTRLTKEIEGIRHLRIVGFGDDEMTRDIIKGGGAGVVVSWAMDGRIVNDGDGDDKSQIFESPLSAFTTIIGPVGVLTDTWIVSLLGADHQVEEVVSASQLRLADDIDLLAARPDIMTGADLIKNASSPILESAAGDFVAAGVTEGNAILISGAVADNGYYRITETNVSGNPQKIRVDQDMTLTEGFPAYPSFVIPHGHPWYLRRKYITLSEVPGGLIDVDEDTIPDDTVHVGGMVDVYASGSTEDESVSLSAIADQNPLVEGLDLETTIGSQTVQSVTTDFEEAGVVPGNYLVIQESSQAGVYLILEVSGYTLLTENSFGATLANLRYAVTDVVDVELTDPREVRLTDTTLKVTLGAQTASTNPLVDFSDYGVIVGDYLRILAGHDKGDYEITEVTGTGSTVLIVNHTWTSSQVGLSFEIYRKLNEIEPPVVSLDTVEMLDSNDEPTGIYVPYAKPLLLEARNSFENVGDGVLASFDTDDVVQLGIYGTVDVTTTAALPTEILSIKYEGVSYNITFTGAATTGELAAAEINAVISDIAYIQVVGTEKRMLIQSSDRLLEILPAAAPSANSILGFSTTRSEFNDQIVIGSGTIDLDDYQVTRRSVINVTSQDSSGYYKISEINNSGGSGNYYARAYSVFGSKRFWLSTLSAEVSIGMPSHGIVRAYFKDPTYFQVQGPGDRVYNTASWDLAPWDDLTIDRKQGVTQLVATINGADYNFYPDPDKEETFIPADSDTQPNNGQVVIGGNVNQFDSVVVGVGVIDGRSTQIDFVDWWTAQGNILEITTYPLVGDIDISLIVGLGVIVDGKYIKVRVADYLFTITFDANDDTLDDLVDAINTEAGETIAASHNDQYLVLESDKVLTLESDGTISDLTSTLFRVVWNSVVTSNVPSVAGEYVIYRVGVGGDQTKIRVYELADGSTANLDYRTAVDIVNEGKAAYFNHRTEVGGNYHTNDDTNNILAISTITYDSPAADIYGAWNDLVNVYDHHDANTGGPPNYHTVGSNYQTGLAAATSVADVLTQYPTFRLNFFGHIQDAGEHNLGETADLLISNSDNNVNLHYKIKRTACQQISPAIMATQQTSEGFYYTDIEVVSEGAGNTWNLDEGTELESDNYWSYGYWFSTGNEALSYSPAEELWLHLTPRFLPQDKEWNPAYTYASAGQNFEVEYKRSALVDDIHNYLTSEQVRNTVQNPLGRHLLPAYVYLYLAYEGGSLASVIEDDLRKLVLGVRPDDSLSAYHIAQLLSRRSAEGMTNPTVLSAVVWESDRSIKLYRSENELDLGIRYALYTGGFILSRG